MNKNSAWRISFILGLVILIFSIYFKFGFANFSALVSLFSFVFLIVNALLPTVKKKRNKNKLLGLIQRAFNVSGWLKTAVVVIWLAIPAIALIKFPDEPVKKPFDVDPLRITYFDLQGLAIEYLLDGKITAEWESKLSGKPYIIQTGIVQTLNEFRKRYGYELEFNTVDSMDVVYLSVNGKEHRLNDKIRALPTDFFQSDEDFAPASFMGVKPLEVVEYFGHKLIPKQRAFFESNKENDWSNEEHEIIDSLPLVNLSNSDLIKLFPLETGYFGRSLGMLNEITSAYMPENFVTGYADAVGCGEGPFSINLYVPRLTMKLFVLENTSGNAVELGQFKFKQFGEGMLRDSLEEGKLMESANARVDNLFPVKILSPGEKIVVPVGMVFTVEIKTGQSNYKLQDFYYSQSLKLEEITVNGYNMPVRPKDTRSLIMIDGSYGGSCPFAFTYSAEKEKWILEDHILYGKNSPAKAGYDTILLKNPGPEILIRELDPEISYIDHLSILTKGKDGSVQKYNADNSRTARKDGKYLVLHQGDSTRISFGPGNWYKQSDRDVYLVSYGFYEVTKTGNKPKRRMITRR